MNDDDSFMLCRHGRSLLFVGGNFCAVGLGINQHLFSLFLVGSLSCGFVSDCECGGGHAVVAGPSQALPLVSKQKRSIYLLPVEHLVLFQCLNTILVGGRGSHIAL